MPTTTQGFSPNCKWEPFVDGDRVGYKCTRVPDGKVSYLFLNPSDEGSGEPDVFVYVGQTLDIDDADPVCFLTPEWKD